MGSFSTTQINMTIGEIHQSRKTEYRSGERDGDGHGDGQCGYGDIHPSRMTEYNSGEVVMGVGELGGCSPGECG